LNLFFIDFLEVARLAKSSDENFIPDDNTPYSELWMGDLSSGPSTIKATGVDLGEFISKDVDANIGGMEKLPFLLKVLSIRKALSIQVHPSKKEAERLHAERPDMYKDPNHKPEVAIALTPFLALCGFRPFREIHQLISGMCLLVIFIAFLLANGICLPFCQNILKWWTWLEKTCSTGF
jgi:mannose-6-phosphate isomerase